MLQDIHRRGLHDMTYATMYRLFYVAHGAATEEADRAETPVEAYSM